METRHSDINIEPIFLVQLSLLLILNTMQRTTHEVMVSIGNISVTFTLFIMVMFLLKEFLNKKPQQLDTKNIYFVICSIIIFNIISYFTNSNVNYLFLFKLLLLLLFIISSIKIKWTPQTLKSFAYVFSVFFLFVFIHWIQLDFQSHRFKSIFRNPNYLAILLFTMLYLKIIAFKYSVKLEKLYFALLITLNIILIYNTNSRTVLLCVGIVLLSWFIFAKMPKLFSYLLPLTLLSNLTFLYIYIKIQNTSLGIFINKVSVNFFGKSFYSGRSTLWDSILLKVKEKPIFGFGLGTNARDITSTNLTAHNQYLQLLIEGGAVSLILFLILLISIWNLLIKRIGNFAAQLSAYFFIAILVYENFEMTLFQNNYSIAMLQWFIITVGISFNSDNNE